MKTFKLLGIKSPQHSILSIIGASWEGEPSFANVPADDLEPTPNREISLGETGLIVQAREQVSGASGSKP